MVELQHLKSLCLHANIVLLQSTGRSVFYVGNLTSKMMGDENKGHSLSAFIRSTQSPEVDFLKLALGAFKMIRAAAST